MRNRLGALLVVTAALLACRSATAVTIDGQFDVAYGSALVTQTTQTSLGGGQISGDNNEGDLDFANGSELDLAHAVITDGVLYLFLAGNLAMKLNVNQNRTVGHILDVFVDSAPGGQNVLNGLGTGNPLNGLTFDAGFEADYWLEFYGDAGGSQGPPYWTAGRGVISGGGGTLVTLGYGSAGGPGTLTGGTNPHGILVTIDNRNVAGVTYGCDASSGVGVTTGIEWAIPLAAIGNPSGCFDLTVIVRDFGSTSPVSNQVLAPAPVGTCPLGPASMVNLATVAGDQFFTVCPTVTDVPRSPAPELVLLGVRPNPTRGDRVRVAFELPDPRPAKLQLIDCAGRVMSERVVHAPADGRGEADLPETERLAPGLYWVRLGREGSGVTRRLCVVR